ncbi:DUF6188 family protein [Streptomyces niveus]|uniref:DUF6188 family protein n=1 Tax=Streptomyces niveus TaxID=193462 RepID=UPI003645C266
MYAGTGQAGDGERDPGGGGLAERAAKTGHPAHQRSRRCLARRQVGEKNRCPTYHGVISRAGGSGREGRSSGGHGGHHDTRQSPGRGAVEVPAELVGARVTRTAFDHQVRISFTDHAPDGAIRVDGELVIETPFTLTDASGHQALLTPGAGQSLAPLLGLFARAVTETEVTGQGTHSCRKMPRAAARFRNRAGLQCSKPYRDGRSMLHAYNIQIPAARCRDAVRAYSIPLLTVRTRSMLHTYSIEGPRRGQGLAALITAGRHAPGQVPYALMGFGSAAA